MDLEPADFRRFFRGIHSHTPFPWQQALVDRLARDDEWPKVLDLPTGSGKTAALDAAVFHLALRADMPGKAALRIALVVDRRLVVDDAFARAEKIAEALTNPQCVGEAERSVVTAVADRLQRLAGGKEKPLIAQRLRGGAPLETEWARTPTQPTILCSTVDQVGSRLLFRGYGVSNRMKPVHAGLLGENSLILLDEAHLSEPFRQTLSAIREIGGAGVRAVLLSATLGARPKRALGLDSADRAHQVLKRRLEAVKRIRLHKPHKGKETFAKALANAASASADRLRADGVASPAIGVVVNRVGLARETFDELTKLHSESETLLMIGRSRSAGRDRVVAKIAPFRTGASSRDNAAPLFIVATQCLEVGVDLDLDGLVTQAAPLDALRQRFGRLNRDGRDVRSEGAIFTLAEDVAAKADDPIYGDRIRSTWEALARIAEDDVVDFGIAQLERQLRGISADWAEFTVPQARAPVLMPAYIHLWSHTSPIPTADPDVGLFLHGAERASADVSLVWRSDLDVQDIARGKAEDLKALMELVPPRAAEALDIPLWAARKWLAGQGSDRVPLDAVADVPERDAPGPNDAGEKEVFRWAGRDDPRTDIVNLADLRPGDLLIVPAGYGGCDDFGWAPDSNCAVEDVADVSAQPFRGRRHAVRIARDVARDDTQWTRLKATLDSDGDSADPELIQRLLDIVPIDEAESSEEILVRAVSEPLAALFDARGGFRVHRYGRNLASRGGAVLVADKGLKSETNANIAMASTEGESRSHSASKAISLDDHSQHVTGWAASFVGKLGLSPELSQDLVLAAFLHDAGKADPRFQTVLYGGDVWSCPDGPAIAKSGRPYERSAWDRAGLPKGWRHEALSVRLARVHPRFVDAHDPALVLWLIGTHHGLGRPFFGFVEERPNTEPSACLDVEAWKRAPEPGPQSLAFDYQGIDWPDLFKELKRKYGVWGLARLEAILRLADHRASDAESAP